MSYDNYMYAIDRSDEYLAHYGVKGMKWGVRKAIEKGDAKALLKHYRKASRKLAKLSLNANRDVQQKRFAQAKRNIAAGATASAGLSAGLTYVGNSGVANPERLKTAALAGLAGGIGGAVMNSNGIMAGRHVSDKGHARAIRKRNEFAKEMTDAFKNTKTLGTAADRRKFQQQIMALSNQKNPAGYVDKQARRAKNEYDQQMRRVGYDKATKTLYADLRSTKDRAKQSTRQKLDRHASSYNRLSAAQQKQVADGLAKLQNRFEGHYQKAMSRGMSHEQAEAYANSQLNGPPRKWKR